MDKEKLQVLIDQYFTCEYIHIKAIQREENWKNLPAIKQPYAVENFEEYEAFEREHSARKEALDRARADSDYTLQELQSIERQLINLLPHGTWFRTGDMGIGIAHFQGDTPKVVTSEWAECKNTVLTGRPDAHLY